jgi:hypothetical protein
VTGARTRAVLCGAPPCATRASALRDEQGRAHLSALDRQSGRILDDAPLGQHAGGAVPATDEPCELVVHQANVFVHPPRPLPSTEGQEFAWARVFREGEHFRSPASLHALRCAPLETPAGWIAPEATADGGTRWLFVQPDGARERAIELAASAHHAWLCAASAPGSRAGELAYLGPAAVDSPAQLLALPALSSARPRRPRTASSSRTTLRFLWHEPRPRTSAEQRPLPRTGRDREAEPPPPPQALRRATRARPAPARKAEDLASPGHHGEPAPQQARARRRSTPAGRAASSARGRPGERGRRSSPAPRAAGERRDSARPASCSRPRRRRG